MDAERAALDARWQTQLTDGPIPPASRFLGFELIAFDSLEGWCEARFTASEQMQNPGGVVQGGFVTAMLDEVMSLAGAVCQPVMSWVPTLQLTTNFIRPMQLGPVLGRGELVYTSKSVVHTEGVLTNEAGKVLARGVAACVPRPLS
ncbi:MAG: PaaI family thioesterase [Pseudomonadota bacterium]